MSRTQEYQEQIILDFTKNQWLTQVIWCNSTPLSKLTVAQLVGNIYGAQGVYIKSDPSILDPTLLGRLEDRGLFIKIKVIVGEVFFIALDLRLMHQI
jgi:hypothetical protein